MGNTESSQSTSTQEPLPLEDPKVMETAPTKAGGDLELGSTVKYQNVKSDIKNENRPPQDITWSNINFKAGDKKILNNCFGNVPAGKVCAIMGPSGAGKSSLLNVLAGRSAPAPGISITGDVTVAGNKINPVAFRKNIAYVMQDDALMATATPREALHFSASLRLPPSTTQQEITELVQSTLSDLGLLDCADVMIGGALIKGISGGQRKRTSVGVEIITKPALLFLDEPTSGLDSFSAANCVLLLKQIAQNNAAVLCTIHQPSSEVFSLFDLVMFLKEGRIIYQGTVDALVGHFGKFGYPCPSNYNPADFVMSLTQTEPMEKLESCGMLPEEVLSEKAELTSSAPQEIAIITNASIVKQIAWLSYRELLNIKRDVAALAGRFGVTIVLNLLFGLIFLNAGGKDDSDPANFNSHFGAITMVTIASMFGAAQPVMLMFPFERPMFMREYSTGTYSAFAYFLSKVALELPMTFLQTVSQYLLVYYLCDFQGRWIYLVAIAWGLGAASCSVAVVLGCLVSDVKDVTEMAPLLFVPQLLFAGFFIRTSQIPVFLRWAQYLCSIKYAMNLLILTEFNPTHSSCQGGAKQYCENVITSNNIHPESYWVYILLLVVLFAGFRVLGALILVQKAKRFY